MLYREISTSDLKVNQRRRHDILAHPNHGMLASVIGPSEPDAASLILRDWCGDLRSVPMSDKRVSEAFALEYFGALMPNPTVILARENS